MRPPWTPDDRRWSWLLLGTLIALTLALMFGGAVFGQSGGDPRPTFQALPIMGVDSTIDGFVRVGDFTNHALRVNVVAGSAGGPSGNIGTAFPNSVVPVGARDAGGFLASLTVTNAGRLNVTCDNCSSSAATFAAAFPSSGGAIGFKDGGGMLASATVDNAGNQFVIASQGSSNWTVTATGTVSAHQADTWTVGLSSGATVIATGLKSNVAASYPTTNLAVGARDPSGFLASLTVSNTNALNVTCDNCNSVTVTSSALPTGASTDVSVQNVEQAVRDTQALYGSTYPAYGQAVAAKDSAGFTASLSLTNTGYLKVNCENCTSTGGTSSTFAAAFPSAGTAGGYRDPSGFMASASVTNNNAVFVESIFPTTTNVGVKPGDSVNNALRVNVVAGSAGGPSGNIGSAFPISVVPVGAKDASGFLASLTVTNAGLLNVTCDNCGGSTFADNSAFTAGASTVLNVGGVFNDGLASVTSGNAAAPRITSQRGVHVNLRDEFGNRMGTAALPIRIDPTGTTTQPVSGTVTATGAITAHQGDTWTVTSNQGTSPWVVSGTVTATGTITAHQGDTWTVALASGSNTIGAITGPDATGSQANGNPVRVSGVAQTTGRALTDGQVGDLSLTTTSDLRVRSDTSAATGTIAPSRVNMMGGMGKNGVATAVTVCDQFATVSLFNQENTQVITGPASGQIHICSVMLITASATSVSIFEGSGTRCNTNRTPIFGSTATSNGLNLATSGGFTMGTGVGDIAIGQYTGSNICIGNSTSAAVSGGIKWTSY